MIRLYVTIVERKENFIEEIVTLCNNYIELEVDLASGIVKVTVIDMLAAKELINVLLENFTIPRLEIIDTIPKECLYIDLEDLIKEYGKRIRAIFDYWGNEIEEINANANLEEELERFADKVGLCGENNKKFKEVLVRAVTVAISIPKLRKQSDLLYKLYSDNSAKRSRPDLEEMFKRICKSEIRAQNDTTGFTYIDFIKALHLHINKYRNNLKSKKA